MNASAGSQGLEQRHYIIVVHGIGEQRLNITATPVVHRFAEARGGDRGRDTYNCLVPAYLSAQSVRKGATGYGWSEFSGIPVCPPSAGVPPPKFDGMPASSDAGQNFRFMEFFWANILQRHQDRYASPAQEWAEALLHRLQHHTPKDWLPSWAEPLIEQIVKIALPIQRFLLLRNSKIAKMIFDGFLGDIHLYGDYERTRGEAVRRFHLMLDETILRDFMEWRWRVKRQTEKNKGDDQQTRYVYQPPVFTIIAHSLGTIMAFDALLYAYAKEEIRISDNPHGAECPSLPFLGYTYEEMTEDNNWKYLAAGLRKSREANLLANVENIPPTLMAIINKLAPENGATVPVKPPYIPPLLWRNQILNFVTLGSPIDKYLVLWWNKYLHMGLRNHKTPTVRLEWQAGVNDWLDKNALEERRFINHVNLCDEQDPVGHKLDIARLTENYAKVFKPGTEVLFRRYNHPGLAHIGYWDDSELFTRIVKEVIDGTSSSGSLRDGKFVTKPAASVWAVLWNWGLPVLAFLITGGLGMAAYFLGKSHHPVYAVAAGLLAILMWYKPRVLDYYSGGSLFSMKPGVLWRLCKVMWEWRYIKRTLAQSTHPHKPLRTTTSNP